MTTSQKLDISHALQAAIQTAPLRFLYLSAVSPTLVDRGIPADQLPKKGQFMGWLTESFRDVVRVVKLPSKEIVFLRDDIRGQVLEALSPALEKSPVRQTDAGNLLRESGVDYQQYTKNHTPKRSMKDWIEADFQGLLESCTDSLNAAAIRLCGSGKAASATPGTVLSADARKEISQLHGFAYMNWKLLKHLRTSADLEPISEQELRGQIAHCVCRALLEGQDLLDASGDRPPRLAIGLGMKTKTGQELYIVFEHDPDADPVKTYWRLADFCYPGEEREDSLGKWLVDRFALDSASRQSGKSRRELELAQRALEDKAPLLRSQAQALLSAVDSQVCPSQELVGTLREYGKSWLGMEALAQAVGLQMPEGGWSLPALRDAMQGSDGGEQQALTREFEALISSVRKALGEFNLLTDSSGQQLDRDLRTIQALDGAGQEDFFEGLQAILCFYQAMADVAEAEQAPAVETQIDAVSNHFAIPHRSVMWSLVSLDPVSFPIFGRIRHLREQIELFKRKLQSDHTSGASVRTADDLRSKALEEPAWSDRWHTFLPGAMPSDPLERALVMGRLTTARTLAPERAIPWEKLEEDMASLTLYDAARRLLLCVGNQNRTAETYLLLGLYVYPTSCARELLALYRQADDSDAFLSIWKGFAGVLQPQDLQEEDRRYLLTSLGEKDPAAACAYAGSNLELLYRQDTLEVLIPLARRAGEEQLAEQWQSNLARVRAWPEPTEIERTLIDNDRAAIRELADNGIEALERAGYNEQEVSRFLQAARFGEYSEDLSALGTGSRLYSFQKNRNSMAERYLWRGLTGGNRAACGMQLLLLLAADSRWDECCALYESMSEELFNRLECRQAYFCALVFARPERVEPFLRANLQDCLAVLLDPAMVGVLMQVEQLCGKGLNISELYRQLLELVDEMRSNALLKSVVLQDSTLSQVLFNGMELDRLQITPKQQTAMRELYLSGSYPNRGTVSGVADRVLAFLGAQSVFCETFARFALPDLPAAEVLQKHYMALGNTEGQRRLLEAYPELRQKYRQEYLHLLFLDKRYEELLSQPAKQDGEASSVNKLERYTAALKTGGDVDAEELPPITPELDRWFAATGSILAEALSRSGRTQVLEDVFLPNFDRWLEVMGEDELLQLVAAAKDSLPALQAVAAENGPDTFVIYCYTHFSLGGPSAQALSEAYYRHLLQNSSELAGGQSAAQLSGLRKLYGDKAAELERESLLLTLEQQLKEARANPARGAQVAAVLNTVPADPAVFQRLLPLFEKSELCFQPSVYEPLDKLFQACGRGKEEPGFFHRQILGLEKLETISATPFAAFLISLYLQALEDGPFDLPKPENAQRICLLRGISQASFSSFQALYGLLTQKADPAWSDPWAGQWLLLYLRSAQLERSEAQAQWLEQTSTMVWPGGAPSQAEFFCRVVNACSSVESPEVDLTRIYSFLCTCMDLAASVGDEEGTALWGEELYLLYHFPRDGRYWSRCWSVIRGCVPDGEAQFLAEGARYDPHLAVGCVDHCLQYEYTPFLRRVLVSWATLGVFTASGPVASRCKAALSATVRLLLERAEPELLRPAEGEAWQEALLNTYCDQMVLGDFHAESNAVRFAALIGTPSAVERIHQTSLELEQMKAALCFELLLAGQYRLAKEELARLVRLGYQDRYHAFLSQLSQYREEELAQWAAEPVNVDFLHCALPGANFPNVEQTNSMTVRRLRLGTEGDGAILMERFFDANPGDYSACYNLYILSSRVWMKDDRYLSLLHKSLRWLSTHSPTAAQRSYYLIDQPGFARRLACLNAVLIARGLKHSIDFQGDAVYQNTKYHFDDTLSNMPPDSTAGLSEEIRSSVRKMERRVQKKLGKREQGEPLYNLDSQFCMAVITGEWFPLLSFVQGACARLESLKRDWKPLDDDPHQGLGFARGLIRLLVQSSDGNEAAQYGDAKAWLLKQFPETSAALTAKDRMGSFIAVLFDNVSACSISRIAPKRLAVLAQCSSEHPCHSELIQQVFFPASGENDPDLAARVFLFGGLCGINGRPGALKDLRAWADQALREKKFAVAHQYYLALEQLYDTLGLIAHTLWRNGIPAIDEKKPDDLARYREEMRCRRLLCQLLGQLDGVDSVAGELSGEALTAPAGALADPVGTLTNLVLLLTNERTVENGEDSLDSLGEVLTGPGKDLLSVLRTCLHRNVSDEQKLFLLEELFPYSSIETLSGPPKEWPWGAQARLYVTALLKRIQTDKKTGTVTPLFFNDPAHTRELHRQYCKMSQIGCPDPSTPILSTSLLYYFHPLFRIPNSNRPGADSASSPAPEPRLPELHLPELKLLPALVEEECGLPSPDNAPETTQASLNALKPLRENCRVRTHLAARLYCEDANREEGLLYQYGVCLQQEKMLDQFSGVDSLWKRELYRELLVIYMRQHRLGKGTLSEPDRALSILIDPQRWAGTFLLTFGELGELIKDRCCFPDFYTGLAQVEALGVSFSQLNSALDCLESYVVTEEFVNNELANAIVKLKQGTGDKSSQESTEQDQSLEYVRGMALEAQRQLSDCTSVTLSILNTQLRPTRSDVNKGSVFGQVELKKGDARQLKLYLRCEATGWQSPIYVLDQLIDRAAFCLPLEGGFSQSDLEVKVFLSYQDNKTGRQANLTEVKSLRLSTDPLPSSYLNLLDESIITFRVENGTVIGSGLYGRKTEKERLESLVSGSDFSAYQNACLYGPKRSGKTSLLKYLEAYIDAHRGSAASCCIVDGQGISAKRNLVYAAFVESVLSQLSEKRSKGTYPDLGGAAWESFEKKWMSPSGGDEEANVLLEMDSFYSELSSITQKGLFLIFDETNQLFYRIASDQSQQVNLEDLLRWLASHINDPHFPLRLVICGPTTLLHSTSLDYSQFFQKFGTNRFPVGQLAYEDCKAMIEDACKGKGILFPPETLDWLLSYTDGMVWYTKLLANKVTQRVLKLNRTEVYPSDIITCLSDVINEANCFNFREGIEEGSGEDRVLNALQSLSGRTGARVPVTALKETSGLSDEALMAAIDRLGSENGLGLLQEERDGLSFALEPYRKYFRAYYTKINRAKQVEYSPEVRDPACEFEKSDRRSSG